ncbi:hypothetical protein BH10CYA1_BH10CYA1_54590 [soil metagenome]
MVFIPMASSRSSRLNFYDESGAMIISPVEGRKCDIVIDVPKELHANISLTLGTVSLPVRTEQAATCAYSVWPGSGPGYYDLSLFCGNIREHRNITVMPEYFTETDCMSMLNDLTDLLPKSIALKLRQCGAQLGSEQAPEQKSEIEEEWLRLSLAITGTKEKLGLLQILPIIQRDCHQILLPRLEVRSADKLRRPELSRLPQAMSMPGNMVANDELYQMFDVTVEQSSETYENQLVKTYVQALRSRLSRLQAKVKAERTPPAMAKDIDALATEFHLACARASFLRNVRQTSVSAQRVTMVLLKNPAYRAVLEGYLALNNQQSATTLEEQALNSPLDKFPFLYQLWANLMVLSALLQVCAESGYRCVSHHWVKSYRKGTVIQVMNDGKIAVQLYSPTTGIQVNVIPWRPVLESQNASNLEAPMSLAIAIEAPVKPLAVLLFDPKYNVALKSVPKKELVSSTEPLKEDIEELLRSIELLKGPGGETEIQYAALLYPGQGIQIASEVEAVSARPAQGVSLQKNICDLLRRYLA